MMTDTRNDWQLLSKADVIREYRYPAHLLDQDIRSGAIAAFLSDGKPATDAYYPGRYYIPRISVEQRIAARAGKERAA